MAQLVAFAVPLGMMPLADCSIISSVIVSLKREEGDNGFYFKESLIRFFSGSFAAIAAISLAFSIPQR